MHPALLKLYRLRVRGLVRRAGRAVKTLRGAVLAIFTLIVVGMMFGPNLLMVLFSDNPPIQSNGWFRELIPITLMIYCVMSVVTSIGERAIYFSPSEIDFLFPAPLTRRQLLLYKIVGNATGGLFAALILATSMLPFSRWWLATFVGAWLAMLFVNGTTICAQLLTQIVSEHAYSRIRRIVLLVVVALAAAGTCQIFADGMRGPWIQTLRQFRQSAAGGVLLAPFDVFGRITTAQRWLPDFLGWTFLAALMNVVLYTIAISLDANYMDVAIRVSRRLQERIQRASRGGAFAAVPRTAAKPTRLPQFPWLGGAGPLIRRQLLQASRQGRGFLVFSGIVLAAVGAPMIIGLRERGADSPFAPSVLIGGLAYLTFLISAQLPLAFKGDLDHMDLLKQLPMHSVAMALGQLTVVTSIVILVHWGVIGIGMLLVTSSASILLAAAALAVPFNVLVFGIENFLFLLFPHRLAAHGSGGFLLMGRFMLFMLVKALALGACAALAAIPGGILYAVFRSSLAAAAVSWFVLLIPCAAMVFANAWAFERFDVSQSGID